MGKTGKERKKRKILHQLQQRSMPVVAEAVEEDGAMSPDIDPMDLEVCMDVLSRIMASSEEDQPWWKRKEYKPLRAKIYALYGMISSETGSGRSLCGRVSEALAHADYVGARHLLEEMKDRNISPKLGSLQRWVRECDAAFGVSTDEHVKDQHHVLRCLDAMMRCTQAEVVALANKDEKARPLIIRHPVWCPPVSSTPAPLPDPADTRTVDFEGNFRVVFCEKGVDRRPPNHHDAVIYTSSPDAVPLGRLPEGVKVQRHDVPHVPGCFVLTDVLTPSECMRLIHAAEAIGFRPDAPLAHVAARSTLAHNVFWLANDALNTALYERCKAFLPGALGLNARWRVYRYEPGAVYRPHIDGAWPGSGLDPTTGDYVYDVYGDRQSKMTFLIRLNDMDAFEGGETTYFLPAPDVGHMNARAVTTPKGSVICFPHADAQGSLLHEGSAVLKGFKYVIRTDVLYALPANSGRASQNK